MKTANPLWKFFCSVQLTIVLLLSLALTSIIGTVIPQNENPDAYLHAYGAFRYQLLDVLGVLDMYHSWWFQGLLVLLTVNIVVCSIDRLRAGWKLIFKRRPTVNPERFARRSDARTVNDKRDVETLVKAYEPLVAKRFAHCQVVQTGDSTAIYGEKGRLSRLGVYIVHLSVIFLLFGGLVGSFFGFEAFVNIPEGESIDTVRLRNTGQLHKLDFQIRCDDFSLTLYENGAPKEYRSALTLLENGKPVKKKDVIVNAPLRYRGINIFQSSYGKLPPDRMNRSVMPTPGPSDHYTLSFTSKTSGMSYHKTVQVGKPVDLPEGLGRFLLISYEAQADFRGMDVGAALKGIITPAEGQPVDVLLPLKFANFDKMRGGDVVIAVTGQPGGSNSAPPPAEARYYTGLQVTRDPGVWLVYSGFILMIAGCFVTFYLSHQQVCIVIEKQNKSSRVILAGTTNRNKLAMQNGIDKMFTAMTNA
ncbi:cytochrome c biogenesis protein ResB [Desulfosarcina ovata subsp. sediminis]|uniref:Cytochrome c biogenesis protein ResB n=1 Tax=Desulfosarcina ovata subsp. sediminis TaxID=885957 RepID=A0A5K7ZS56_9BACT|nr:cytochrome c biogenesis protein ResB [Desulfosarcina ovata]BBO83049.1 cytochrome c biogenesis protein ResB [Desulfosarcina ovata subsp. sediminis]